MEQSAWRDRKWPLNARGLDMTGPFLWHKCLTSALLLRKGEESKHYPDLRGTNAETPQQKLPVWYILKETLPFSFPVSRPFFPPVLLRLRLPRLNLQAWRSFFLFSCTESFKSLLLIPQWPARPLAIAAASRWWWWCEIVKSEVNTEALSCFSCLLCSRAAHSSSPLLIKPTCRTRWVLL